MDDIECAKRKIAQLRAEIDRLRTSDFHHPRIRACLDLIEGVFHRDLRLVERLDPDVAPAARQWVCGRVNRDVARFHRLLGIILRSTNARNSFEVFDPLLRISKDLLGHETMLILSSEWEFSPFADPSVITGLENYVFVGLPVSEAANSLVVPLAGHELGHSVWRERDKARELRNVMQQRLVTQFSSSLSELRQKVDDDPPSDLHEGVRERWWGLFAWGALERVSEEIFCDFMGVRIFGDAYLCAFMYLVSPHLGVTDRESYPSLDARAGYMSYARRRLGVRTLKLQVPKAYSHWFSEPEEDEESNQDRLTYTEAERFLLSETHKVARSLLPEILDLVQGECQRAELPVPDARHAEDVYRRLRARVPAEGVRKRGVADIINGGWMAFLDSALWRGNVRKFENINQLVFKSLEVMEFEERTDASKGRRTREANSPSLARS